MPQEDPALQSEARQKPPQVDSPLGTNRARSGEPSDGRVLGNAAIGLVFALIAASSLLSICVSQLTNAQSWRFPLLLAGVVAGVAAIALFLLRANRRGFDAGCLLGLGLVLLCPFVAVLVICGTIKI
jgi:hypothetical protein